jgi:predicted nuclease with TOPRIM domain
MLNSYGQQPKDFKTMMNTLESETDYLQNQVDYLATENNQLENELDQLNDEYDDYVATHEYSNLEYDEAQFDFYYILPEEQWFGIKF